jgi:recombination protein RecA
MGRTKKNPEEKKNQIAVDDGLTAIERAVLASLSQYQSQAPDRMANAYKTPFYSLNKAMNGGVPRGQIIHLYGQENSGKSTLALQFLADVQKQGGSTAYEDIENSVDLIYAQKLGVDVKKWAYYRDFPNGEVALDAVEKLSRAGISLVALDSIATLCSKELLEAEAGTRFVGLDARMITPALKKLMQAIIHSDSIILLVNQLRANIQPMSKTPWITPGGNALRFNANIGWFLQRTEWIKDGEETIGQLVKIKIMKSKVSAPQQEVLLPLLFGTGFDRILDLIYSAISAGLMKKDKAAYSYEDLKWRGIKAVRNYALEHPDFLVRLEAQLDGVVEEPAVEKDVVENNNTEESEVHE